MLYFKALVLILNLISYGSPLPLSTERVVLVDDIPPLMKGNEFSKTIEFANITTSRAKSEILPLSETYTNVEPPSFVNCIFWEIGAMWIGIIVGNMCKIKGILCPKSKKTAEQGTQYEPYAVVILEERRKLPPTNPANSPMYV